MTSYDGHDLSICIYPTMRDMDEGCWPIRARSPGFETNAGNEVHHCCASEQNACKRKNESGIFPQT